MANIETRAQLAQAQASFRKSKFIRSGPGILEYFKIDQGACARRPVRTATTGDWP
jgi:hypothetical protein